MQLTKKDWLLKNDTSREQLLWQRFKVHSIKSLHPQQISKVGCTYSRSIVKLVVSSFGRISTKWHACYQKILKNQRYPRVELRGLRGNFNTTKSYYVSSDFSRFEWESVAIFRVSEYWVGISGHNPSFRIYEREKMHALLRLANVVSPFLYTRGVILHRKLSIYWILTKSIWTIASGRSKSFFSQKSTPESLYNDRGTITANWVARRLLISTNIFTSWVAGTRAVEFLKCQICRHFV